MKPAFVLFPVLALLPLAPAGRENHPPVIRVGWSQELPVYLGEELRFTVQAHDPDGDPLTLRLESVPPGLVFTPAVAAVGPVRREVVWTPPHTYGGYHSITFEAFDHARPSQRTLAIVPVHITGYGGYGFENKHNGIELGDVTGDGRLDAVVTASGADVGGVTDTGAAYVWSGSTSTDGAPSATLAVPNATASARLGAVSGNGSTLVDLDGDGLLDVVIGAMYANTGAGAVYVWFGGRDLRGSQPPDLTFVASASQPSLRLGHARSGEGLQFADVTGDGLTDVVATAEIPGTPFNLPPRSVYVFAGGRRAGVVEADAVLTGVEGHLGLTDGQGVQLVDVTGDDVLDIVATTPDEDYAWIEEAGAIFVWAGGPALAGVPPPTAKLFAPTAVEDDRLGRGGDPWETFVRFADVTGDGETDVVAAAPFGGNNSKGRIYLFEGGSGVSGDVHPLATLKAPAGLANDRLANDQLRLEDVTGDGVVDVLAASTMADVPLLFDVGAIHVFAGGPTAVGAVTPVASLYEPAPAANATFGERFDLGDVTGDGVLDILAGSVAVASYSGVTHVFAGGAALSGTPSPAASLATGGPAFSVTSGRRIELVDLTRDGVLDVVGIDGPAAYPMWAGGGSLAGAVTPTALLTPPASSAGSPNSFYGGEDALVADVTGDGNDELVLRKSSFVAATPNAGAVLVWEGAAGLSGSVDPRNVLTASDGRDGDLLGWTSGQGLQLADFDDDGVLDVVATASRADAGGVQDAGAVYGWSVLAQGALTEAWTFQAAAASVSDRLGYVAGQGVWLGDLVGDRGMDVLAGGCLVDLGGVPKVGALYLRSIDFDPAAPRRFSVPGAGPLHLLGY